MNWLLSDHVIAFRLSNVVAVVVVVYGIVNSYEHMNNACL